jgi:hypothetical protein
MAWQFLLPFSSTTGAIFPPVFSFELLFWALRCCPTNQLLLMYQNARPPHSEATPSAACTSSERVQTHYYVRLLLFSFVPLFFRLTAPPPSPPQNSGETSPSSVVVGTSPGSKSFFKREDVDMDGYGCSESSEAPVSGSKY